MIQSPAYSAGDRELPQILLGLNASVPKWLVLLGMAETLAKDA
jgi:hypothetical protein